MKRIIQVFVTCLAAALIIWGAFFSRWRFADQMMDEPSIIKQISDGVCLS